MLLRRRLLALLLLAAAVAWVLVNHPVEGRVLADFGNGHGLTEADLLSVALAPVAVWLWLPTRRSRRRWRRRRSTRVDRRSVEAHRRTALAPAGRRSGGE